MGTKPTNLSELMQAIVMIPGHSLEREATRLIEEYIRGKFQDCIDAALEENDDVMVAAYTRLLFKLTRG